MATNNNNQVGVSATVRIGTPKDREAPAALSEKERMMQGFPYKPWGPELVEERKAAHTFNRRFNQTESAEERKKLLLDFIHPESSKEVMCVEPPFRVDYGYNIKVGKNFYANFDCVILDSCLVEFGDDCMLAPGVHLYTAYHPLAPEPRKDPSGSKSSTYYELAAPIKIGNTCWIGGKTVICPGVTIGDNVVIGAGSVVTKNVPSNVVVAGNPAKIIRYLDGADIPQQVLNSLKA